MSEPARHPAPFSRVVLEAMAGLVPYGRVLDPFAGTGRVHELAGDTVGVEIEMEWAGYHRDTIVGDATRLPFRDSCFDAAATSPCYGNRMADHHEARDGSHRRTYRHYLGRRLHPRNAGQLQWGEEYRDLHLRAWGEAWRVLRPKGVFVLNVKDHVRGGEVVPVTAWHDTAIRRLGFVHDRTVEIPVAGYRFGSNRQRVDRETLLVYRRG